MALVYSVPSFIHVKSKGGLTKLRECSAFFNGKSNWNVGEDNSR